MTKRVLSGVLLTCLLIQGCSSFSVQESIGYCASQARKTLAIEFPENGMPNSIPSGSDQWQFTFAGGWTSGFWPGELWYLYEGTEDPFWKEAAIRETEKMMSVAYKPARSHDVGFMMTTSIGNAYRLTGDIRYKDALVSAADSLAKLYNPNVGTILSWPNMVQKMGWPHNTIIDNMLNLELLFQVALENDRQDLYDLAFRHAEVTMKHIFREDWSTFHVMVFDEKTGEFIAGHTHQGWKDESTWSRGQAWAVYGFTMAYRFTQYQPFLEAAMNAADFFLSHLPEDMIAYWDFDAQEQLGNQPRDCSASAIVASALLELQGFAPKGKSAAYLKGAKRIIKSLSSDACRATGQCSAFLLHATGHMPNGYEIDASISYADYYYIESLIRLKNLKK